MIPEYYVIKLKQMPKHLTNDGGGGSLLFQQIWEAETRILGQKIEQNDLSWGKITDGQFFCQYHFGIPSVTIHRWISFFFISSKHTYIIYEMLKSQVCEIHCIVIP